MMARSPAERPWVYPAMMLIGAWLVVAPWLLPGAGGAARWNGVAVGVLVSLAALPLGRWRDRYGAAERAALWVPGDRARAARWGPPATRRAPAR